jgi:hypothetical protein
VTKAAKQDSRQRHNRSRKRGTFGYRSRNRVGRYRGQFIYSATTSPTKTYTMICGGSGTGNSGSHNFTINATYSHGVGIKSCGQIKRLDNNQVMGTSCKTW